MASASKTTGAERPGNVDAEARCLDITRALLRKGQRIAAPPGRILQGLVVTTHPVEKGIFVHRRD
jgi:hypothetical protein